MLNAADHTLEQSIKRTKQKREDIIAHIAGNGRARVGMRNIDLKRETEILEQLLDLQAGRHV